uniref:Zinc metalloproteinase n=1 Tax=Caenorhabditis tropicalis TaxID=1561998 RepID=A0A1I7UIR3_9PELO
MLLILLLFIPVSIHSAPTDQVKRIDPLLEQQKKYLDIIKKAYNKKYPEAQNETDYPSVASLNKNRLGLRDKQPLSIPEINAEISDYLYQSDLLLTEEQAISIAKSIENDNNRTKRQAVTNPNYLWDKNQPIHYEFRASLNPAHLPIIRRGIKFWNDNTCLDFKRDDTAPDRLSIFAGDGCYTYYGKRSRVQDLSIGYYCEQFATVTHEIMHALGFTHHQLRDDRDDHIILNVRNIKKEDQSNFAKTPLSDGQLLNIPYDYGSVMHYYPSVYANDTSKFTMMARQPLFQFTMGQLHEPSFTDILAVNRLYNCASKCPTQLPCSNAGYTDPRNCNQCKCPPYFSGRLCRILAPGTSPVCNGQVLHATSVWQSFDGVQRDPSTTTNYTRAFTTCNWHIIGIVGRRVEIKITSTHLDNLCFNNCFVRTLEINLGKIEKSGFYVCCRDFLNRVFTSESDFVALRGYIENLQLRFTVQYRIA